MGKWGFCGVHLGGGGRAALKDRKGGVIKNTALLFIENTRLVHK